MNRTSVLLYFPREHFLCSYSYSVAFLFCAERKQPNIKEAIVHNSDNIAVSQRS